MKTITLNKDAKRHQLKINPEIEVVLVDQIADIAKRWDGIVADHNLFCQSDYLQVLESAPPEGIKFAYLIFLQADRPVGGAILQIQYFKASQNIRYEDAEQPSFFRTLSRFFRNLVASYVEFNVLVCGNMLLTGEHGFHFSPDRFTPDQQFKMLDEALDFAQQVFDERGIPIAGNLLKDYYEENNAFSKRLTTLGYHEFVVQPNMVLKDVRRWKNFDEYLANLSSKYRTRYKRARKKAKDLRKIEFTAVDIEQNLSRMYELYNLVAENSGFNLVNLNNNYMKCLKEKMGDRFRVFGFYQEEELVGYYSTIHNYEELEAHFLGFDPQVNRKTQIYLNMLYDILEEAVDRQVDHIVYARTAMEIKSSVGAVGVEMYCYLKHQNQFTNHLLPSILDLLKPSKDWKPRNPFN